MFSPMTIRRDPRLSPLGSWSNTVCAPNGELEHLRSEAATHAVFFGAGRYSLVVFPLVAALGVVGVGRRAAASAG